jgi:hypothetical protein
VPPSTPFAGTALILNFVKTLNLKVCSDLE